MTRLELPTNPQMPGEDNKNNVMTEYTRKRDLRF
jgi:hypothetical protein